MSRVRRRGRASFCPTLPYAVSALAPYDDVVLRCRRIGRSSRLLLGVALAASMTVACHREGPDLSAWDMPARTHAIKGVWRAWWSVFEIAPGRVRTSGGRPGDAVNEYTHIRVTPCGIEAGEPDGSGWSSVSLTYLWKDGALHLGQSPVGIREGTRTAVCVVGGLYLLDEHGCQGWGSDLHGGWQQRPAVCGYGHDGDREFFYAKSLLGSTTILRVEGDVMWGDSLAGPALRAPRFEGTLATPDTRPPPPSSPREAAFDEAVAKDHTGQRVTIHGIYLTETRFAHTPRPEGGTITLVDGVAIVAGGGGYSLVVECNPAAPTSGLHAGQRIVAEGVLAWPYLGDVRPVLTRCTVRPE